MNHRDVSRRTLLKGGGAALAGLGVLGGAGPAHAFPSQSSDWNESPWDDYQQDLGPTLGHPGDAVIPWLDQPPPQPFPAEFGGNQLKWETLESWLIPAADFHHVNHFGIPDGLDESTWRVGVAGLVARPLSLTVADLKARKRREVDFTLECSGNTGPDWTLRPASSAMPAGPALHWPRCWRNPAC